MQAESEQNLTFVSRANSLKFSMGWTDTQLCEKLGISRTMLHFIKTGKNRVSQKNWFALDRAEAAAGVRSLESSAGEVPDVGTGAGAAVQTLDASAGEPSNARKGSKKSLPTLGETPPVWVQGLHEKLDAIQTRLDKLEKVLRR